MKISLISRIAMVWGSCLAGLVILSSALQGCIDQIEPQFQRRENLIFVDASLTTEESFSSVQINRSTSSGRDLRNLPERDAIVRFHETGQGRTINLTEIDLGVYVPPTDFVGKSGETWMLEIELSDGTLIHSSEEIMFPSIPMSSIEATYKEELRFEEAFDRFVPGHTLSVSWDDPPGEENYYTWRFKSYEPIVFCQVCQPDELWRNGKCVQMPGLFSRVPRTYTCETSCWEIRYHDRFNISSDAFFDGKSIDNFSAAEILFYRDVPILVELVMLHLSPTSYEFLKIIQDIQEDSRGLNAPPPAPLFGNLRNVNDPDGLVLGHFVVAAASRKSIYLERNEVTSKQLEERIAINPEICNPACVTHLPCEEGIYRTAIKPKNWPE